MATTISDVSNDSSKDGLLKDVYLDGNERKKKAKQGRESAEVLLHKTKFGPYGGNCSAGEKK